MAESLFHQASASAGGDFQVNAPGPGHEEQTIWIEATITIVGVDASQNNPDEMSSSGGRIIVGGSEINYESVPNGLHITGTLADLDGNKALDFFPAAQFVVLTARQQVLPEEFIRLSSSHSIGSYIKSDGDAGQLGVIRHALGRVFFRAFVGTPGIPGDYNDDGRVDAGDFVRGRNHLGEEFRLDNEGVGVTEGMVTIEDYAFWKQHYGEPNSGSGGLSLVPEPSSAVVVLIGLLLTLSLDSWQRGNSVRG